MRKFILEMRPEPQMSQCGKWLLHQGPKCFPCPIWSLREINPRHSMIEPECGSDVVSGLRRWVGDVANVYRQFRPDIQHLRQRSFGRSANNLQIQVTWRCKRHISPFSAYMYQRMPLLGFKVIDKCCINEEFEYSQENIIR
jgi:hypothetical protein